ncbi:FadR/GntR family transcriptional regulator [Nocardioides gilvus]|uniref:FadR/GntR family transcriptional regulator n=1 Tax=Nocardioides gilvus TaxID=1735589 RepID=UPI000D7415B7|nr:FCD domain-containing protein [Nocardioides gilvus]
MTVRATWPGSAATAAARAAERVRSVRATTSTKSLPPDPSDTASMHGRVVDQLGTRIAGGEMTGLIDPARISAEFGISRSLVRECLRTLAAKGMVRARQRTGTAVTDSSEWALLDEQVIRWRSSGPWRFTQMEESLQLRGRLEPLAARLSAISAPAHVLHELTRATERIEMATHANDSKLMIEADTAFHRLLYLGSGNDMLSRLAGTVHACLRMPDFQRYHHFINTDTAAQHRVLLDLLRAHDEDGAEAACARLMELTFAVFRGAQERALNAAE